MRPRLFFLTFAAAMCLAALASGQSGSAAERLANPQSSVRNFLDWQNPPNIDMEIAAEQAI